MTLHGSSFVLHQICSLLCVPSRLNRVHCFPCVHGQGKSSQVPPASTGGHGWVQTRVFSPSAEDVKLGSGPAASICKHVVNDPIFPSICSPSTCQLGGAGAGCSNGEGWEQQPGWVLDPALTAINSHQLSSDNAGSFKSVTTEVPMLLPCCFSGHRCHRPP